MATKAYELLAQVKDLVLVGSSDTSQDTILLRHMNQVQQQIYLSRASWRDLQTTTNLYTTELMTLDVAPATAWAVGDTITGATSAETCVITRLLSTTTFEVKDRSGTFTLGEVLSNGTYTADQGATRPTFTSNAHVYVPSDMALLYTVRQTSDSPYTKLTYVDPQRFHEIIPQPTQYSEGKPIHYTWWGDRLYFYPIPDDTYTLSCYYYKRPTNMKIYTTGTAAHSGLAVTGTDTVWLSNSNVDTNMFFAYTADMRSDGTYPWSEITAVSANTTLAILAYAGADTTGTYICSSESSFGVDFDPLIVYGTAILFAGKNVQATESITWLKSEYDRILATLSHAQDRMPDWQPVSRGFTHEPVILGDYEAKFPFIRENL